MSENFDKEKLTKKIIEQSGGKINNDSINKAKKGDFSAIFSALDKNSQRKLKEALNNKNAAEKLLGSKQAKEILNSFLKKDNNGRP